MEEETDPKPISHINSNIGKDTCFNNFSDEFIAFGNMMCEKLNDIVELLKMCQDNMQKMLEPLEREMKVLLEDRHNKNPRSVRITHAGSWGYVKKGVFGGGGVPPV